MDWFCDMSKPSEETKRKISESVKRRWMDKEYRDKVSNAHKHKLPDEWKRNISNGMKGLKKSEETKRKMSLYQSNRTNKHEENFRNSWKEQWNSLTKAQQLERLSNWIEAGHNANKSYTLKPSSLEIIVKKQLDYYGVKYVQQKHINDGNRNYYLDFYLPGFKLVIEVNGSYWHNKPKKIERDNSLKRYVESTGRKIIFIWDYEIKDEWFCILDYIEKGGDYIG